MTKLKSITDIGNIYESNVFTKNGLVIEEAKNNNKKFPKDSFPKPNETLKKSNDFDSTGPNKALNVKTNSKTKSKKNVKKNSKSPRKIANEDINSFMKSKFDKLFENVMEDDKDLDLSTGPGAGPEGGDDFGGGEDELSDLGGEEGGEEVTITLDKETAQKLVDLLQAQLDVSSEEESDLEDLEIEDEDLGGEEEDLGGEEENSFREGSEAEKLPDSAGHKLTKAGTVGNIKATGGKASSDVTDDCGTETKGDPLDHKSPLQKPGTVGNLKAGSAFFGNKG
jgi:hypothetical protein